MPYKDRNRENEYRRENHKRPEVKAKKAAYQREYTQRPEVKAKIRERKRWAYMRYRYNITKDEYLGQIEAQLGRCLLCGEPMGDDIVIDHNHETGKFRGLLHNNCNIGLGQFNDDPELLEQAVAYLRRHRNG